MDKVNAVQIKIVRRYLLSRLDKLYPSPITCGDMFDIAVVVQRAYDKTNYRKDIYYFVDKGWVEFGTDKLCNCDNFDGKIIILTAKGKEIAEGTKSDRVG